MGELGRDAEFTEYARARAPWLRKVAYLLCGDWHRADDLMQGCMLKYSKISGVPTPPLSKAAADGPAVTSVPTSPDLTAEIEVGLHGTLADTARAVCTTSAGLDACVWHGGSSAAFDEIGGAKGLLKHVTLLGPDEKNWTTDVLVP
jgi:hypothetical protein